MNYKMSTQLADYLAALQAALKRGDARATRGLMQQIDEAIGAWPLQ